MAAPRLSRTGVDVSALLYPPGPGGRIALFGSGETARVGRRVHELLMAAYQKPVPVAVIETPAGFQPNTAVLASDVKAFFEHSLQNFKPEVTIVPARYRGDGPHGTDEVSLLSGIDSASYVFAGAGSPTYAVRHLSDSRLWRAVGERLEGGATLALASAMALAVSTYTLPVYEIFKVGEELAWTCSAASGWIWRSCRTGTTMRAAPSSTPAIATWAPTVSPSSGRCCRPRR
jgi:hypothetical protein